jgi:hypothetical protein
MTTHSISILPYVYTLAYAGLTPLHPGGRIVRDVTDFEKANGERQGEDITVFLFMP